MLAVLEFFGVLLWKFEKKVLAKCAIHLSCSAYVKGIE